jgi:phosphoribosylformylglycinamidine synthase PurS subunit
VRNNHIANLLWLVARRIKRRRQMGQGMRRIVLHKRSLALLAEKVRAGNPGRRIMAINDYVQAGHVPAYTLLRKRESFSFFSTFTAFPRVKSCNVYLAKITIRLKPSIQDPQGLAVQNALHDLGFKAGQVRMGKFAEVWIDTQDRAQAEQEARDMCEKLLVNGVMETFEIALEEKK